MRRISLVFLAMICVVWVAGRADSTTIVTRYPIAAAHDDAWQRGTTATPYAMQPDADIVYLGRSDTVEMKMNGGFRFVTTIAANTVVKSAFLQGFNDWGQQLTVVFFGDKTAGAPNFDAANLSILARARTMVNVQWNQASIQSVKYVSSPDLAPIINYLDTQPGWNGTIVLLAIASGGSDQSIDIRSFEHVTGPAAVLEVQT